MQYFIFYWFSLIISDLLALPTENANILEKRKSYWELSD